MRMFSLATVLFAIHSCCHGDELTMLLVKGVPQQQVTPVTVIINSSQLLKDCLAMLLIGPAIISSPMLVVNGSVCTLVTIPASAVYSPSLLLTSLTDVWVTSDQLQRVTGLSKQNAAACPSAQPFVMADGRACCQIGVTTGLAPCSSTNLSTSDPVQCCAGNAYTCTGKLCYTNTNALSAQPASKCNSSYPTATANGFFCCASDYRLNNLSLGPTCDGDLVDIADPYQCCAVRAPCANQNMGCTTCFHPNMDGATSHDLAYISPFTSSKACQAQCQARPDCLFVAWNSLTSQCFVKGNSTYKAKNGIVTLPQYCP